MKTLKPFFPGIFLVLLVLGAPRGFADHAPESEILTLYLEINIPVCNHAEENKTMNPDCQTPIPEVFECWKSKIHLDYDATMLLEFLAEVRNSNQRYQYYNEPFYNELFSNRNWDNLMDYSDRC